MTTKENQTNEKPVLVRLADGLLQAQQELDELMIQFALGKAEARDKFEELKQDFKNQLSMFKTNLDKTQWHEITQQLQPRINELEQLLSQGITETKEIFEVQRKKISNSLAEFEVELLKRLPETTELEWLYHEIEKFKLKLEIIRLKFILKKFSVKDSFRDKMKEAKQHVLKITDRFNTKLKAGTEKASNFRDEIQLAYNHLRKAIDSFEN
ncbi:MAG: hypothetical protein L6Q51_09960 [Cyclobacteriaceae bacterium]|nr:hypothetical protein [Cyclobacteriaceae bacterium]